LNVSIGKLSVVARMQFDLVASDGKRTVKLLDARGGLPVGSAATIAKRLHRSEGSVVNKLKASW